MSLVLNSIVVMFFACFLAYTFFAQKQLESLARDFVTEKTLGYSKPMMEIADEAIDSPLVQRLLTNDQATAIRKELADYRDDPASYISDLTRQKVREQSPENGNPLLAKVMSIKSKIRDFYDDTLNALIADLRIFSVSSLVAGIMAFGLAFHSSTEIRRPIAWFSLLMLVAVLYCSYLYIDDLTFFKILFQEYMGWWYAAFLCITIVSLYLDYGYHAMAMEQGDAHSTIDSAASKETSTAADR